MSGITVRLKAAIEKSSLTYDEIEKKLELPEGSVEKWVSGAEEPDTQTLKALAPLLGVSADRLLFGVEKIGEMKAMFPNDAKPASTPMSDWRFLAGVIMVFTGIAGLLLMFMMYYEESIEPSLIFDVFGWPAAFFAVIAIAGIILCVVTCIVSLRIPKRKKKKKKKKDDGNGK